MKKVYATLFAAALGLGTVCAQELSTVWVKAYDMEVGGYDPESPDWNSPSSVKTQPGMRNAVGIAGKLYGIDMRTMSVTAFDADGASKAFDLPSLNGQTIQYVSLDASASLVTAPDYYGSLISRDDAGHLIVGHGYNTGATCNTWTVLDRATGATKRLVGELGTNYRAYLPNEVVSRAIGDVTKEGYLYVGPTSVFSPGLQSLSWVYDGAAQSWNWIQLTKIMKFTGDGTVNGTNMESLVSGSMPLSCWFYNYTTPWYSSLEAMKEAMAADPENVGLNQTFFLFSRLQGTSASAHQYGAVLGLLTAGQNYSVSAPFSVSSCDLTGYNYAEYIAFDTFELDGERYYVAAYNEDSELKHEGLLQFAIFDSEGYVIYSGDDMVVWSYEGDWDDEGLEVEGKSGTFLPSGTMTLNVEKVDDNNVNIYLWAQCEGCGVVAGMFNFGNGNTGSSAVNEVAVEANDAVPVYYNLNGARVANPANGIFIEKRGSKVTKVIK